MRLELNLSHTGIFVNRSAAPHGTDKHPTDNLKQSHASAYPNRYHLAQSVSKYHLNYALSVLLLGQTRVSIGLWKPSVDKSLS